MAENTSFLITFVLTLLILNQGSATVSKAAASFSPAAQRRLTMRSRSFPPNSDSAILLLRHSYPKPYLVTWHFADIAALKSHLNSLVKAASTNEKGERR